MPMTLAALALVVAVAAAGSVGVTSAEEAAVNSTSGNARRLVDTRPGSTTFDGLFAGGGAVEGGETLRVRVAGRINEHTTAATAMLNVTVTEPAQAGYLTVFACDVARPHASSLNYAASQTVANLVPARLDADGDVCIFTLATAHVIIDGATTLDSSVVPLGEPRRLMDTRHGQPTIDGAFSGGGALSAGTDTRLDVAGRGGVRDAASAVLLNVTVVNASEAGYVMVHACDTPLPGSSNVNYAAGTTVANMVISRLDSSGAVCIFSLAYADIIVDVSGELVAGYELMPAPRRILDTRPDAPTFDGFAATGKLPAGLTWPLPVGYHSPIEPRRIAIVNVTAIEPAAPGFLTVHTGRTRPNASNLAYEPSTPAIANLAMVPINNLTDLVCIFTSAEAHLAVDVVGFIDADLAVPASLTCPPGQMPEPGGPIYDDLQISDGEALAIAPRVADEYGLDLDRPFLDELAVQICTEFASGTAVVDVVAEVAIALAEHDSPDNDRIGDAALDLTPLLGSYACNDLAQDVLVG